MSVVANPFAFAIRELDVLVSFTRRDWTTSLIPSLIIALGAVRRSALPIFDVIQFLPWATSYIYFFDLSNQITGVEEDRINKPDRPIPSGKVTLEGAKHRWILALFAFVAMAVWNGTQVPETLTWVLTTAALSVTPAGGHWFTKNIIAMTVGTWALLSGVYKTIATPSENEIRFFIAAACWGGIGAPIQDFRDVKGDAATGRKTLPIVLGDKWSRRAMSFILLPISCYALWAGNLLTEAPVALGVAHAVLGYRVLQGSDALYDRTPDYPYRGRIKKTPILAQSGGQNQSNFGSLSGGRRSGIPIEPKKWWTTASSLEKNQEKSQKIR